MLLFLVLKINSKKHNSIANKMINYCMYLKCLKNNINKKIDTPFLINKNVIHHSLKFRVFLLVRFFIFFVKYYKLLSTYNFTFCFEKL